LAFAEIRHEAAAQRKAAVRRRDGSTQRRYHDTEIIIDETDASDC